MNLQFHEFEKKSIDGVKRKEGNIPQDRRQIILKKAEGEKGVSDSDMPLRGGGDDVFHEGYEADGAEENGDTAESGVIVAKESNGYKDDSERRRRYFHSRAFWAWAGGGAALFVLAAVTSTVFARLTVIVKPRVESVEVRGVGALFDVSASKMLASQKIIPAELLEFKKRAEKEFDATGEEHVSEKARGKAILYNTYSSSPQKLVATTRFVTDGGVLFRLKENVTVPGAKVEDGKIVPQSIEIELAADAYGKESNLGGPVTLFIPGFRGSEKYKGFYASAPSGFQGGFQGKARVISKSDRTKAEDALTEQALKELRLEIVRKVPHNFTFIDALAKINIHQVDIPAEKTRLDRFRAGVEGVAHVLVFREEDVHAFLKGVVIGEDTTKEIVDGSFAIDYTVQEFDSVNRKANVLFEGSVKTKKIIFENDLASLVRGRTEASVIEVLKSRNELTDFSIAFFPPWLFSAPDDEKKIRFMVE